MPRLIDDSWLHEYLRYTQGQESPQEFHMWTGLSIIAAVLGRNVWLDRGYYKLFPNIYVMLVAEPGICKKSVATSIGVSLLQALPDPPYVFAQKVTPERLIQALSEQLEVEGQHLRLDSSAFVYAPEASVFLGKRHGDDDLLALLTTFYDCPDRWSYETKTQGKLELHNVCLNMLAATTPEWLKAAVPPDAAGGGFASRIVFVYAERPSKLVPFPELSSDDLVRKQRLIHDLQQIQAMRGTFSITNDARTVYSVWYEENAKREVDPALAPYLQRKPDTILKLAMVLAAAEADILVIERRHILAALNVYKAVEDNLPDAVSSITTIPDSEIAERVLKVIARSGGAITHTRLMQKCWRFANATSMPAAIDTLEQMGAIEVVLAPGGKGRTYKLKEAAKSDK